MKLEAGKIYRVEYENTEEDAILVLDVPPNTVHHDTTHGMPIEAYILGEHTLLLYVGKIYQDEIEPWVSSPIQQIIYHNFYDTQTNLLVWLPDGTEQPASFVELEDDVWFAEFIQEMTS